MKKEHCQRQSSVHIFPTKCDHTYICQHNVLNAKSHGTQQPVVRARTDVCRVEDSTILQTVPSTEFKCANCHLM